MIRTKPLKCVNVINDSYHGRRDGGLWAELRAHQLLNL